MIFWLWVFFLHCWWIFVCWQAREFFHHLALQCVRWTRRRIHLEVSEKYDQLSFNQWEVTVSVTRSLLINQRPVFSVITLWSSPDQCFDQRFHVLVAVPVLWAVFHHDCFWISPSKQKWMGTSKTNEGCKIEYWTDFAFPQKKNLVRCIYLFLLYFERGSKVSKYS